MSMRAYSGLFDLKQTRNFQISELTLMWQNNHSKEMAGGSLTPGAVVERYLVMVRGQI